MINRHIQDVFLTQTIPSLTFLFLIFHLSSKNEKATVSAAFLRSSKMPQNPCAFSSRVLYHASSISDQDGLSIQLLPLARDPSASFVSAHSSVARCVIPIQYEHRFSVEDMNLVRRVTKTKTRSLSNWSSMHTTTSTLHDSVSPHEEQLVCLFGCLRLLYRVSIEPDIVGENIIPTGTAQPASTIFHVLVIMQRKWPSCHKPTASQFEHLGFESNRDFKEATTTQAIPSRKVNDRKLRGYSFTEKESTPAVGIPNIPIGAIGDPQPIRTTAPGQPMTHCVPSEVFRGAGGLSPFTTPDERMPRVHRIFHHCRSYIKSLEKKTWNNVRRLFLTKSPTSAKTVQTSALCTMVALELSHRLRLARAGDTLQSSYSETVTNVLISTTDPLSTQLVVPTCVLSLHTGAAYSVPLSPTSIQKRICQLDGCKVQHFRYEKTGQIVQFLSSARCTQPELLSCPLQASSRSDGGSSGVIQKKTNDGNLVTVSPANTQSRKPIPAIFEITEPSDDRQKAVRKAIKRLRKIDGFGNIGDRDVIRMKVVRKKRNRFKVILWFRQWFLEQGGDNER